MTRNLLSSAVGNVSADVQISPNNNGLPGIAAALKIAGALLTFGLIAAVAGIVLVHKLKDVSELQDCLMTRATNCAEIDPSPPPATSR